MQLQPKTLTHEGQEHYDALLKTCGRFNIFRECIFRIAGMSLHVCMCAVIGANRNRYMDKQIKFESCLNEDSYTLF